MARKRTKTNVKRANMKRAALKKASSRKKTPLWEWILIGVVSVIAIVLLYNRFAPQPGEISVDQAAQMRDQGAFILDVREPDEWENFHIPGSTLIPLGELPYRVSEVPADQKIVVVCNSGNRSLEGRDILLNAGFTDVTSMAGGVQEWRNQGLPIETGP